MNDSVASHITHTFDSFCKTVIRNEARNIKKQYAQFRERQISLTELPGEALNEFQVVERTLANSEVFLILGMEFLVSDLALAESIHQLDELKRKIIILYYFAGFTDREIGDAVGMSVGGVWYQREKAKTELRKSIEDSFNE